MLDKDYFLLSKIASNVGQIIDAEHWTLPVHFKDNPYFEVPSSFCFGLREETWVHFFISPVIVICLII